MRITFDSNSWRQLVSPATFPKEPDAGHFTVIRDAMKQRRVFGFLCETVFTLESIQRKQRQQFIGNYKADIKTTTKAEPKSPVEMRFVIGPSKTSHANNNPHLAGHLNDAKALGFKLLRFPRVGGIKNTDLKNEDFAAEERFTLDERQKRAFEVSREIEAHNAGIAQIKKIANKYANGKGLVKGINAAPASEFGLIANAVAEWADGDAISAHYGYGNDYFCTRDNAKAAGGDSVFSPRS